VSTSKVPTGAMVTSTDVEFPDPGGLVASINRFTRKDENVYLDAQVLAETLFDDHMAANMLVLGAAYQAGAIAVSAEAIEEAMVPGRTRLSEGVARYLFKLMAYKDEYEVARLHRAQDLATALAAEFPGGVTVRYNLHPPFLRALGMNRKLKLGKWFDGVFRLLVGLRRLRGTALDPFGYAELRGVE